MSSESDQSVPHTFHHAASATIAAKDIEGEKPNYFQRMITRSKQQLRSLEDQPIPTATPNGSAASKSDEVSAIKTAYHFADNILSSGKASSDTLAFVDIIQQVRQGVEEANKLYVSAAVSNFLGTYPNKRIWVNECLEEAKRILNDIGMDVELAWGRDEDGGTVASKRKFEWGLKNQKKMLKRQQQLIQYHIKLMGVIQVMQTVGLCSKPGVIVEEPIYEAPVRPWVLRNERDTLRGPYSRQKHRLGSNHASMSSLALALAADKDDIETASVNSAPVELAGSIPSGSSESQTVQDLSSSQNSYQHFADSQELLRRPRAFSEDAGRITTSEVRSRASIDTMIGRYDSTLSAPATIGVPMIARRYQAIPVDIQGHTKKYKLPLRQLPILINQPSLVDDLADYVLPSVAVKGMPGEEWPVSPTQSVSPTSVTRSLTIDHTLPVVEGPMAASGMVTNSTLPSMKKSGNEQAASKELFQDLRKPEPIQLHSSSETFGFSGIDKNPEFQKTNEVRENETLMRPSRRSSSTGTTISSASSLKLAWFQDEVPFCRPSSQRPSRRKLETKSNIRKGNLESTITSQTLGKMLEADPRLPTESSNVKKSPSESTEQAHSVAPPPMIVIDDACQPILAKEIEVSEDTYDEDLVLSALWKKLQKEGGTEPVAETLAQASLVQLAELPTGTEQPILAPPAVNSSGAPVTELEPTAALAADFSETVVANEISTSRSNESEEKPTEKMQMSAQAKRRAAHARRMHLAFGNDVAI